MPKGAHPTVTKKKAREILRHGEIGGKPLTKRQKDYFGDRAGGQPEKPARKPARRKTASRSRKRR